jgi:hypothetical protein
MADEVPRVPQGPTILMCYLATMAPWINLMTLYINLKWLIGVILINYRTCLTMLVQPVETCSGSSGDLRPEMERADRVL